MLQGLRKLVGQVLSNAPDGVGAGYRHPGEGASDSRDSLAFTGLVEREKLAGGQLPPTIDPHTARRTAAQERQRIDDRPIP